MDTTIEIEEQAIFSLAEGVTVKVAGPDGTETDDEYEITEVGKVIIGLRNLDTGETDRAHPSRIMCILSPDGERTENPYFMTKLDEKPKPRIKHAPKKKEQKAETLDFEALKEYGEVWSKKTSFDHDMQAEAHCLITKDKAQFWVFNTYNGSVGKKGGTMPPGKEYGIASETALNEKLKQLRKNGYELRS